MRLIVGLGNPGAKYERTRHNIGFRVVDKLAERMGISFGIARHGCVAAGDPESPDGVVLLKPLLYMNCSGDAVERWARAIGAPVSAAAPDDAPDTDDAAENDDAAESPAGTVVRPLVICDDISLPLGSIRMRARGSDGGHRGLESLINSLGGREFPRLRLGVAGGDWSPRDDWAEYVLARFEADEWPLSEDLADQAADAVECWLAEGVEIAAGRFNRRSGRSAEGGSPAADGE